MARGPLTDYEKMQIRKLVRQGKTMGQTVEATGISENMIRKWVNSVELHFNGKRGRAKKQANGGDA